MKKTLIILTTTLLLLGLVFLLYLVFFFEDSPEKREGISRFIPFGDRGDQVTDKDDPDLDELIIDDDFVAPYEKPEILRIISHTPIALGVSAFKSPRLEDLEKEEVENVDKFWYVRYVEKETGYLFEVELGLDTVDQLSDSFISSNVFRGYWTNQGVIVQYEEDDENIESLYMRTISIDDIRSGLETIPSESIFLPKNISRLAVSPNKSKIASLIHDEGRFFTSNPDGRNQSNVLSSPIKEWNLEWATENILSITTAPAGEVGGHNFFFNQTSRVMEPNLRNIPGLTTKTSPDSQFIFYAESGSGRIESYFYNHTTGQIRPSDKNTLPEKCVWSSTQNTIIYCAVPKEISLTARYPDYWYQGQLFFSDEIWRINADTGRATLVENELQGIDAINLFLDEEDDNLFFINKRDSMLWVREL